MLSVVTFKWATPGYRATFTAAHVNTLRRMVARHYRKPHRFICITDDPAGLDAEVEHVPLWNDHRDVPNPTGGGRPSCYLRLKLFDPDIGRLLGDRFVMMDLDAIVAGDLSPLFDRTEDAVFWRSPAKVWPYNGAMMLLSAGARPQVWKDFDPVRSPLETQAAGYRGSDQAWISHKLGWHEAVWTDRDGVYYYGTIPKAMRHTLPPAARIVFTTGGTAPWTLHHPWIRQHYQ
jgi:hypothetical protein